MGDCDFQPDRPSHQPGPRDETTEQEQAGSHGWSDMQGIIDAIPAPIFFKDTELIYAGCNRAFATLILGSTPESIIGKSVYDVAAAEQAAIYNAADQALLNDGGTQHYTTQVRYQDGQLHDVEFHKSVAHDATGSALGLIGTMLDITERRRREKEVERLAYFDALTGLPNRRHLREHAETALAQAAETDRPLSVLYLDLDRIKDINDTLGHDVGDRLLVQVATRLRQMLRERDMLARLGGDEFAIVTPVAGNDEVTSIAHRLLLRFKPPFFVNGHAINLRASIGVVRYPSDGATLDELLKHADIAMYRAKAEGSGFTLFETAHGNEIRERVNLERDLARAIGADEIDIAFQPLVHVPSGRVESLEALARWKHPRRGAVPPSIFIPLAEAAGLVRPLGERIQELTCRQLARWRAGGLNIRAAINVSARELQHPGFADTFLDTLARHGLPGEALEVELTETALMTSPEDSGLNLRRLRDAGIRAAVDDFGTGYSSLTQLKRLPVATLKIDREFVAEMTTDTVDAGIVETIVALAHGLGLTVVGEGAETKAQQAALLNLGCEVQQGYRFCRPLPAAGIETWLARETKGGHILRSINTRLGAANQAG